MTALHRVARFLGLIPSRHPAGCVTGWACLSRISRAAFDDFSRPGRRPVPFVPFPPLTADPFPFDFQETPR